MLALSSYTRKSGLEESLVNLVCLRASQINECAYCIDMHWKDLRAAGENEQRLYGLDAWEESPYYSDRERAALAWTEAITNIRDGHVQEDAYHKAQKFFSEKELADLTLAVAASGAPARATGAGGAAALGRLFLRHLREPAQRFDQPHLLDRVRA
jgi:AhpD family alkylhydroperoxidase